MTRLVQTHAFLFTAMALAGLYFVLGILGYQIFFALEPYNDVTGDGATAYKVLFSVVFAAQVLATAAIWAVLASRLEIVTRGVIVLAVVTVALIGLVNMWFLTAANACQGVPFPYESSCPTQEGT